jgi:geranylgeranyl diphosphate synthase type II
MPRVALVTAPVPLAPEPLFEEQVDAVVSDMPARVAALWGDVARRTPGAPELAHLVAASSAADGGKYLRPRLVGAAYYGLGGRDDELVRHVAAAQQLLHVGLCIHDDVIDEDRTRHGAPNVAGRIELEALNAGMPPRASARLAEASAILAGDLALNAAVLTLLSAPAPSPLAARLATTAMHAIERAVAGELLDIRSESTPPERAEPLRIALLKTASYSVTLPLLLGALAAGREDPSLLDDIERVGGAFGIAYQLCDDDLGLFGSSAATGKSVLSDLRDGKRTEHIRLACQRASRADRAVIESILGRDDIEEADAARVLRIVAETGARADVLALVDDQLAEGVRVAQAGMPPQLARYLGQLAQVLRRRDR